MNKDKFKNSSVIDEEGHPAAVGTFWKNNPAVLVFLRHFGCVGCRAQAAQLWEWNSEIEKLGARLVFIGNGPAWAIKGFKEDLKVNAPIYTDPTLEIFKAAALKRGQWATLGFRSIFGAVKLFFKGHRQKGMAGDPWQQGGVVIVKPDGQIPYVHADRGLGDEASGQEILQALKNAGSVKIH